MTTKSEIQTHCTVSQCDKCLVAPSAICSECSADPWWEKNDPSKTMKQDSSLLLTMIESSTDTAGSLWIQLIHTGSCTSSYICRHIYSTGIILLGSPFTLQWLMCSSDQLCVNNSAYYPTTLQKVNCNEWTQNIGLKWFYCYVKAPNVNVEPVIVMLRCF